MSYMIQSNKDTHPDKGKVMGVFVSLKKGESLCYPC